MLLRKLKNKKGFTLIELIVVIAILAILALLLIPRFSGFRQDAAESTVLAEARSILTATEALDAQDETLTLSAVNDMLGRTLEGVLTISDADSFTYVKTVSGFEVTATVTDGSIAVSSTAP